MRGRPVTALAARVRPRALKALGALATLAGTAVRHAPAVGGPLLIAYGLGLMYGPLLFVSLGVVLIAVDRRTP